MRVIVDTSAYYAMVSPEDAHHRAAAAMARRLHEDGCGLWSVSYVASEAAALIQTRLGLTPLRQLREALDRETTMVWVDADLHVAAWDELERIGRRQVSLVDCALAVAALREGISEVFAYDPHFALWDLNVIG
jgi:predicted nucleic acid-binding protein